MSNKNYYTLEVTTTQQCNLRCTYCFEGDELDNPKKPLSALLVISKVKELLNDLEFIKIYNGITINFWGGEPTLNVEYCQQIIAAFAREHNIEFFFYTNGYSYTNITKILNYAKMLDVNFKRIRMQISYDGIWNDENRVLKNQSGTSEKVMETFSNLFEHYNDIHVSLKSTLPVEKLVNDRRSVVENWKYFRALVQNYGQRACYNPTLEYTNFYKLNEKQIDNMKHQLTKITRLELEYFEQNGSHVMSWYNVRNRQLCSAGMNIGNIDLDGNITMCHGSLYNDKKDDLIVGNIKGNNFVKNILDMRSFHFSELKEANNEVTECTNCSATVCYQCPTVNYQHNGKFHQPKKDLCSIYKHFGLLSNTLYKYLRSES